MQRYTVHWDHELDLSYSQLMARPKDVIACLPGLKNIVVNDNGTYKYVIDSLISHHDPIAEFRGEDRFETTGGALIWGSYGQSRSLLVKAYPQGMITEGGYDSTVVKACHQLLFYGEHPVQKFLIDAMLPIRVAQYKEGFREALITAGFTTP